MSALTELEYDVLNATADDFESLEHFYRSLNREFSAEHYDLANPESLYWREAARATALAEIAEAIRSLVARGLLEGQTEDGSRFSTIGDASIVWRGWFHTTPEGQQSLAAAVQAAEGDASAL
jgi:hypothetical protein